MLHGKQIQDATIPKAKLALVAAVAGTDPVILTQLNQAIADAKALQNWKDPVRVAVFTNINIASPGASIDGIALAAGESVLLGGETTASTNGPYIWNGAAVAMTRRSDFDISAEAISGAVFPVQEGSFADKYFKLTTNAPIVLGTTALTFQDMNPATSSAVMTLSNKNMAAVVTTADGDVACNTAIAATPTNDGYVRVFINSDVPEIGDGVKTKDCYFSGDSGVTARSIAAIASGDKLYWNGSIAGYQLAATDKVSYDYSV